MFLAAGGRSDDLIDFVPDLKAEALRIYESTRLDRSTRRPRLEPHRTARTQRRRNWWSGAFDPVTGRLYVPSWGDYSLVIMEEHPINDAQSCSCGHTLAPYGPQGLPLFKPPYAQLTAFDMVVVKSFGAFRWEMGRGSPALRDLNLPPLGGVRKTGWTPATKTLLFIRPRV